MRNCLLCLVFVLIVGCCEDNIIGDPSKVQNRLASPMASGDSTFDFADDSTFVWDRMFVFAPYSTQASVESSLGMSWPDYRRSSIEVMDDVCLVIFVQNGKVVDWYEQPRFVDLVNLANKVGYRRSEAKFQVVRLDDGRIELKILTAS